MYYIILIFFYLYTPISNAQSVNNNKLELQYNNAKALIENNCTKCATRSTLETQKGIEKLKKIVEQGKNGKYWSLSMELLGDAYTDMYNFSQDDEKYFKKIRESYQLAYANMNESEVNSGLVLKHVFQSNDRKKQLKLLKPILGMQSDFSQAKYHEGKILIEQGSIEAGLEALEVSVATALYANIHYNGDDIARILTKHGRNEAAKKILDKKK